MENTIENNKLLAEFMGYIDNGCSEEGFLINPITNYDEDISELKYNSDWNYLMEVVQKILSLYEYYHFKQTLGKFDTGIRDRFPIKEGVYNMCIEFVKWYNEISAKEIKTEK